MEKKIWISIIAIGCHLITLGQTKQTSIQYVASFDNINHPQVAYWFFSKDMLQPETYKGKIDSLSKFGKYTLVFLTARNGINFHDTKALYPILENVVAYAHEKGLKIGLQLWDSKAPVAIENTERLIQEQELQLDENGSAACTVNAKHARDFKSLLKSELFKVYAFKKTAEGFYNPATLTDVTNNCTTTGDKNQLQIQLNAPKQLQGYTAYLLTQHYYNFSSNHSADAVNRMVATLQAYANIPFDGVGLDEFTNLRVATTWELKKSKEVFTERSYSLAMVKEFKSKTGQDLDKILFDMRYAPTGQPQVRIQAINAYMACMREGTMHIEKVIYDIGKAIFGANTFIGLHDTHHNFLDGDEVWQTGLNWWNVKRDYGHSDEGSPTPTRLGIGMSYKMNVMYNMFYDKSLDKIVDKALTDLRYGIRTHYHAINDVQGWGVSVEKPASLLQINKVENAARLLNRFNPPFPQVKLLVLFGMEAQLNWFPDSAARNSSYINGNLKIEEKAKQIWDAGYCNILVPTDVIADGRLKIGANGKPVLNGHEFDAVVCLYPQFAKETTLQFLENYTAKGGKLMVEGAATNGFDGKDISNRWKKIADKAAVKSFSIEGIEKLGIAKNGLPDGALNEDGSYTFTSIESLKNDLPAIFSVTTKGAVFSGTYKGLAAIQFNEKGNVTKLAATGFTVLKKDGNPLFELNSEADVFIEIKNGIASITIADGAKNIHPTVNKL